MALDQEEVIFAGIGRELAGLTRSLKRSQHEKDRARRELESAEARLARTQIELLDAWTALGAFVKRITGDGPNVD